MQRLGGIWDPLIGVHERDVLIGRELVEGWDDVDRQLSVFHEMCLLGRDVAGAELREAVDRFLQAFENAELAARGTALVRATIASLQKSGVQVIGKPGGQEGLRFALSGIDNE